MIPEFGHFALILALVVSLVQGAALWRPLIGVARSAAFAQFGLVAIAYLCLSWAYIVTDLSVLNVVANSHSLKPLIYRIAGVWGNHEGSLLLWILMLALFGALLAIRGHDRFMARALAVQGLLGAGFIAFCVFTSNPFARILMPPIDGQDLNPVLQDPALALHPPLLYAGYVGFSVVFALAVAALIENRMDQAVARLMRPWTMLAWTGLTAGIALGSWWAYYELGWGGWWFWDPVENASLMPWLLGTALLHSLIVAEHRGGLKRWVMLLAILTFSLSLLGTFLVRSGVLTSVHAFAVDPDRGLFILALLAIYTGGALALYAWRAPGLSSGIRFAPVSRESALVLNNLFLATATATVLIGTLYPLLLSALDAGQISVGPPYFNATFVPLCVPLLLLMAAGPLIPWKSGDLRGVTQRLALAALAAGLVMLVVFGMRVQAPVASMIGLGLAAWLVLGTLTDFWGRSKGLTRLSGLPAAQWSLTIAHLGVGIAVAGMIGSSLWVKERAEIMQPGQRMEIGRYSLTFQGVEAAFGPNYTSAMARVEARPHGSHRTLTLAPERRHYPVAEQNTTETAIHTSLRDDLYLALGEQDADGGWVLRAWVHPLVPLLWLGFTLIVLGGAIGTIGRFRCKKA